MLLHGGVLAGELCWHQQLPLTDRFGPEIVGRVWAQPAGQSG
jgi:hypothetical protein